MRTKATTALATALAAGLVMTGLIWISDGWLNQPNLLPDAGPSWYVWQRRSRSRCYGR